jgi:iron complex outermembrane receptor protein
VQRVAISLIILLFAYSAEAQEVFNLRGFVRSVDNKPLAQAHVFLQETRKTTVTRNDGSFEFSELKPGTYRLHVSYLGYKCIHQYSIDLRATHNPIDIIMVPEFHELQEVSVVGQQQHDHDDGTLEVVKANASFLEKNTGHSLIKSLESLPGIQAMEIGQGLSKPVIRGLGFNRLVVAHGNSKLEGQQWGVDHGLEFDQFLAEQVEVIKGPASLLYGSDAIGGVIRIHPPSLSAPQTMETQLKTITRSVNNSLGMSLMNRARIRDWFWYTRFTWIDFADYKVPADSFYYNRYRLPIFNGLLKNTAGMERNAFLSAGKLADWGKVSFTLSRVSSKTGFFPGAHGIPSQNNLLPDGNNRDINLPYQQVEHITASAALLYFLKKGSLHLDLAWQRNNRKEWSAFHTHYPSQQLPLTNPDMEFHWVLHTLSFNTKYSLTTTNGLLQFGLQSQMQQNKRAGYMFLLPDYQKSSAGVFALYQRKLGASTTLMAGSRYDLGNISIDQYISPYTGKQKSPDFKETFHDLSWSAGLLHQLRERLVLKTNVSKSFRTPGATELGSNGIHHGSFRYELGDTTIRSEYAYQLDVGIEYSHGSLSWGLSPFAGYFPNFIFLNPSGSYLLPDGSEVEEADAGQIYRYEQTEAYRAGLESWIRIDLHNKYTIQASAEYVAAGDGTYPLPFTPPFSTRMLAEYKLPVYWKLFHMTTVGAEFVYSAAQSQVARNESQTPAFSLVNLSISTKILTHYFPLSLDIQIQNLFNTRYLNHLSFYRQLGLPEAGRNAQLVLTIPLETKLVRDRK